MSMPQTRRWSREPSVSHAPPTRNAIVGATWVLIFIGAAVVGLAVAWLLAGGLFTAASALSSTR